MRVALVLAMAACGHGSPTPVPTPVATPVATPTATTTIPIQIDGKPVSELAVTSAPIDLWTLCARAPDARIAARSTLGTYAEGRCDQRGGYRFILTDTSARLETTFDGTPSTIAEVDHVATIELVHPAPTEKAPGTAGLTITFAGSAPALLSGATLDALTPTQRHREGVPLTAILAAAHVAVPARGRVVAITDDQRYEIAEAWLLDPKQSLVLRHNNQGLLRFDHVDAAGKTTHLRGVRSLEVLPPS